MKPHEVERRIQAQYSFHLEFEQLSENAGISLRNSDPMIEQRYLKCVDLRDPSRGDLWHPLLEKIRETVTSETGSHKVADIHDLIISALKSRLPEQAYGKYHDEPIGAPGGGAGPSNGRGRAGGSRPRDEKRVQFSDKSKYRRTEGGRGRGNSGGGGRELPAKTRWVPANSETPLLTSGEHADQGCRLYHHQSPTQPGKSSHRNRECKQQLGELGGRSRGQSPVPGGRGGERPVGRGRGGNGSGRGRGRGGRGDGRDMGTRTWIDPAEKSGPLTSRAAQSQMAKINAMITTALEKRDNLSADMADKADLAAYREAEQGGSGAGTTKGPAGSVSLTALQADALRKSIQAGKAPRLFHDTSGNWSAQFQ